MSSYARMRRGFHVDRLDQFDEEENGWREIVVEDRRAGPAETAATKIDFGEWLRTLTAKQQKITNLREGNRGRFLGPLSESLERVTTSPTAKFAQTLAVERRKRKPP